MVEQNVPEVVDEKKNLPEKADEIKQPPSTIADFGTEIEKLLPTVGTISLSKEEEKILYAPVDEKEVEIRSDGLIYLPWTIYVSRMRKALGLSWGLIPSGLPKVKNDLVMWPFWFIIRGTLVTFAIGEQLWSSSNRAMSFPEACEGARSNALMRSCKAIGLFLELWTPEFIRNWKEKYATQVPDPVRPEKKIWVRGATKGKMTPDRAVSETKEVFPGAEVVEDQKETKQETPESPPEKQPIQGKSSALLFSELHDEMVRLNHIEILRAWWTKNAEEAEKKLHPEHFKLLFELKDKMRADFKRIALEKSNKGGNAK